MNTMSIISITTKDFEQQVLQNEKPVILDFWAPWCGYCRSLEPLFQQMSEEQEGRFLFAKVNIDEEMALAEKFQVMTIPTLLLFRNGETGERLVAPGSKEAIEDWLKQQGAL